MLAPKIVEIRHQCRDIRHGRMKIAVDCAAEWEASSYVSCSAPWWLPLYYALAAEGANRDVVPEGSAAVLSRRWLLFAGDRLPRPIQDHRYAKIFQFWPCGAGCGGPDSRATRSRRASQAARTIRIILPVPPGGAIDIFSRVVAEQISTATGTNMIIESKPGAGGIIAAEYVAHAPPDGNTLLSNNNGIIVSAILHKVNYDPLPALNRSAIWSPRRKSSSSIPRRPIARSPNCSIPRAPNPANCRSPASGPTPRSTSASSGSKG